jgi:hypothetical protein
MKKLNCIHALASFTCCCRRFCFYVCPEVALFPCPFVYHLPPILYATIVNDELRTDTRAYSARHSNLLFSYLVVNQ